MHVRATLLSAASSRSSRPPWKSFGTNVLGWIAPRSSEGSPVMWTTAAMSAGTLTSRRLRDVAVVVDEGERAGGGPPVLRHAGGS